MKKRTLFTSLLLVLALLFTACGDDNGDGKKDGDKGNKGVETEQEKEAASKTFDDAASHITYANFNSIDLDGMNIDLKARLEGDFTPVLKKSTQGQGNEKYIPFMNELLQTSKLHYNLQYKLDSASKKPEFSFTYGLINSDNPIVDVSVFSNQEKVYFASPTISNKTFSITYDKLTEDMSEKEKQSMKNMLKLDIQKYIDLVLDGKSPYEFYEENFAAYKKLYDDYLNANVETISQDGSSAEYKIKVNYQEIIDLYKKMLQTARDDVELQKFLISKNIVLIDEMLESKDYELLDITEEELKETKAELEARKDTGFGEEFQASIDDVLNEIEANKTKNQEIIDMMNESNIEYTLSIEKNKIKSSVISMDIKDLESGETFKLIADVLYSNDVNISAVNSENTFDISDFLNMKDEELQTYLSENPEFIEFVKGFGLDAINFLTESENMKAIYDLMDKNGLKEDKDMIKMQLTQLKTMAENMTNEQIIQMMGGGY